MWLDVRIGKDSIGTWLALIKRVGSGMIFVLCYGDLAMARPPRIEYPGALYHVITRGNRQQRIFVDDKGRQRYVVLLVALKKAYAFRPYAYVLMRNHVHLLLETGKIPYPRHLVLISNQDRLERLK